MHKIAKKIYQKVFKTNPKTPYKCSVCGFNNITFKPLPEKYFRQLDDSGFIHSIFLFETLNLFNYACSNCNAPDRDRLYALYFNEYFKDLDINNFKLLDIAPVNHLSEFLLQFFPKKNYRTADLYMDGVDDKIDLQNMNIYEDNSWDFVLCSHVLEHVEDDVKALSEIHRILKPQGKAILMVPINLGLAQSIEADQTKTYTDIERWKYFGQDDHQRLYSKEDFISRIESVGFRLKQLDLNYFGEEVFKTYGINKKSVLYIGEKI